MFRQSLEPHPPMLFYNHVYLRWRRNFKCDKSHGKLENVTLKIAVQRIYLKP